MSSGIFTLVLLNLALMGLLPRIFFRSDGRFNLMWWLTAAPFFLVSALVCLYFLHVLSLPWDPGFPAAREALAALLCALSLGLMCFTLGTHRRRLSLWHQSNDAPEEIVTYGAYKRIRHPFYASFILAMIATVVLCPSPWTATLTLYSVLMLNYTAAGEERKLSASAFGDKYRVYMTQSGRFLPKF